MKVSFEELVRWLTNSSTGVINVDYIKDKLALFEQSNIIIQRGKNPHPDAELLHQVFEDMTIQIQAKDNSEFLWSDMTLNADVRFRIKSDEADMEYQYDVEGFGISVRTNRFYTEDMAKLVLSQFASYTKVEETMRPKSEVES